MIGRPRYVLDYPSEHAFDPETPNWRCVANTIQPQFTAAVDRMLDSVRSTETFTEPVVAAIDITNTPYHVSPWKGEADIDPDDERIGINGRTKVPKDGYPTMVNGGTGRANLRVPIRDADIVGRNAPLVIAIEPVRHESVWEGEDGESTPYAEVVDRLMEQATDLVDIHLVMADRAFDTHGVTHVLDQYPDVNYLLPKKTDSKRLRTDAKRVHEDDLVNALVDRTRHCTFVSGQHTSTLTRIRPSTRTGTVTT